ncbi:hypothetical protein MUK42_36336 [Musa troglodytarum]|uniref:Uncharacterized protein n=1 Tax=Musa troglodytarum TaxID=320322 RepID=A0A9E7FN80_9LILI|nr:hypothetical protein MUK42_36336 [Musa troglodytarum]
MRGDHHINSGYRRSLSSQLQLWELFKKIRDCKLGMDSMEAKEEGNENGDCIDPALNFLVRRCYWSASDGP